MGDTLPSKDDWQLTPNTEVEILLARWYGPGDLTAIGAEFEHTWFDENDVTYKTRERAREAIAVTIHDVDKLQDVLRVVPPSSRRFGWFRGHHYVAGIEEGEIIVSSGPSTGAWQTIVETTTELTQKDDALAAFLWGIINGERTNNGMIRTDYNQAQARGTAYYDDGQLWPQHLVELPATIPGIMTRNPNSGRSYSVAREIVPLIEHTLEQFETRKTGPVKTPEQTIPDDIDRRVPTFGEVLDGVEVMEEDVGRFERILDQHDALAYWRDYIAPTVKFRPRAKQAILCMLASPDDLNGTKGRTNAIIYGPPGTGKTAFKNFLVEEFGAFSIDGARVSRADLTYNKNTGADGLLVRAHKGLAVIEEADELDPDALGAALTSLGESGHIEIQDIRLPAKVRGIMLGNYESRDDIVVRHSEALFNRFEFVLYFDRLNLVERDAAIDWQYDQFRQRKQPTETADLKKFIAWVREFDPEVPDAVLFRIKEYKSDHINAFENVREGISVLNVAYVIARLNHRDVTLADYEQAFELVEQPGRETHDG